MSRWCSCGQNLIDIRNRLIGDMVANGRDNASPRRRTRHAFATHAPQVKLHDGMLTVKQHDYSTAKGRQICDRLEADYPQQEDSRFRTPPNTRQHMAGTSPALKCTGGSGCCRRAI